jgi:hypothetical protein
VRFDHLDDDTPVEPSDELRESVDRRAARLRRRRTLVPGAAAVVVAALAILGIATVANETNAPARVFVGNGPTDSDAPIVRRVTRDGVTLQAKLWEPVARPGDEINVTVTVTNRSDTDRRIDVSPCVATGPIPETGWFGYTPSDCPRLAFGVVAHQSQSRTAALTAPSKPGAHGVVVSWGDRGKPTTALILRLAVENVPAGTLRAHIELDRDTYAVGDKITGNVVVDNDLGHTVSLSHKAGSTRCGPQWAVVANGVRDTAVLTWDAMCRRPALVPTGTTQWPFTVSRATPLPAGRHKLTFISNGGIFGLTKPSPVDVTVAEPESARGGITSSIVLDNDVVKAGGELKGTLVIENDTSDAVELRMGNCFPKWAVAFARPGDVPDVAFTMECGTDALRIPQGTTRLPFTMRASLSSCSNSATDEGIPRCLPNSGTPALAPGKYQAVFVAADRINEFPIPEPVDVTVVP